VNTLFVVLGVLGLSYCAVASVWSFVAAWRGSAAVRRVLTAKRTRALDLEEGQIVEMSGTLSLVGDGIVAPSGKSCAAAQVTIRSGVTKPENGTPHTFSRGAASVLTDETGSASLGVDHLEIVAPTYEKKMSPHKLADASAWLDQMPKDVRLYTLLVAESVIEDGAVVNVRGRVERIAEAPQLTADGGYRDAAPRVEARYRIVGNPDDRLLLTQGKTGKVVWRAGWPAFALFAFAGVFFTHAAVMVFLLLAS